MKIKPGDLVVNKGDANLLLIYEVLRLGDNSWPEHMAELRLQHCLSPEGKRENISYRDYWTFISNLEVYLPVDN